MPFTPGTTGLSEMTSEAADKLSKRESRVGKAARSIAVLAFFISMSAIGIGGYCDYRGRTSPAAPDPLHGYTDSINYKGAPRYVSHLDAELCSASFPIGFVSMGIFVSIGFWYRRVFGHFIGEKGSA
jgi:hypothetical protein